MIIKNKGVYEFEQFLQLVSLQQQEVDLAGIDLDGNQISFKAYIGMKPEEIPQNWFSKLSPCGFLADLREKDMIYRLETVQDTRKEWNGRYDVALDYRTNENMQWLFQQLKTEVPFLAEYEELLCHMSSMRISEHPDYQQAALYHLGVQEKDSKIQALKFYFTARHQDIPKYHTKDSEYRDDEYLDFWGNCGFSSFSKLKDVAKNMRVWCGGHVWLAGLDISKKGIGKCKIYLKKMHGVYAYLKTAFGGSYREGVEHLENFNRENPWLHLMGIAIGLNDSDHFSLNLYFSML